MKVISLFQGPGGEQSGAQQLALRWGAGLFGRRHAVDDQVERRAIQFALDARSLWRIAGNVRDARIGCRRGRLWLTQAGAPADVILQPGQSFVAGGNGAIVVQPVPAPGAANEVALGTLTLPAGAARVKIHRGRKAVATTRIETDPADHDPTGFWEQLVFITLWLCGTFSVGYCLKAVLSLP